MHKPVLLKEVIKLLNPQPGQNFVDATVGGGGHALEILKLTPPHGRVLGLDWDEEIWTEYKKNSEKNTGDIAEKLGELGVY